MTNPNRVHIDAPAGIIDIEGEKDFVEGMLAKLFPLIEEAGFGSRPRLNGQEPVVEEAPAAADAEPVDNGNGKARSRTRKAGKKPPAGHSCAERILALKSEGYFSEKRSTYDMVTKLAERRQTHNVSQVSAAAGNLVQRSQLQRIKDGNGWLYYWDRD